MQMHTLHLLRLPGHGPPAMAMAAMAVAAPRHFSPHRLQYKAIRCPALPRAQFLPNLLSAPAFASARRLRLRLRLRLPGLSALVT
jgi:hypothetical protein